MSDRRRVVWFEGMTLDPHHLQQWDRAVRADIDARVGAVARFGWGLAHLEVDRDRLANGEFALVAASGILPDGLPFQFPRDGPVPAARDMADGLAPTAETVRVYLAVPSIRAGGANVLLDGAAARRETRFIAETATIPDDTTGADERDVQVGRVNARVVFESEAREDLTAIPIAEVGRAGDGSYALRPTFIAPSVAVNATAALDALLRRTTERLAARSGELSGRWQAARNQREISPGDVTAQALLSAAAEYAPRIDHLRRTEAHPADAFGELAGLAGRLWAAVPNAGPAPSELPAYDHADPTAGFHALVGAVEQLLGGTAPRQNYTRVPLVRRRANLFHAPVAADVLDAPSLVLAVRRQGISPEHLRQALPPVIRVASPDTIEAVIRSATLALTLQAAVTPPSGLPVDPAAAYFVPRRSGPFWDAIREAGAVALFTPAEFADAEFELLAPTPG
ncbi:type VI secretion system baseplate subunit TssK [Rubrivirga sp. IMCC43871]|uniref:type VI secretion system baseplate subunit TssK n=1 Tax=Rubrivirga sp. IMCC43871 TaxID=3391575 RepID=UPI00398FD5D9